MRGDTDLINPAARPTPHSYALPDVLPEGGQEGDVIIVHHHASATPSRMRLRFSTHALSIVLSGQKQLAESACGTVLETGCGVLYAGGGQFLTTDSADYSSLMVFFTPNVLADVLDTYGATGGRSGADDAPSSHSLIRDHPALADEARHRADTLDRDGPPSVALRRQIAQHLLLIVLEARGVEVFAPLLRAPHRCDADLRVGQVLGAHWREGLNVDELAFLAGMSTSTFQRRVRAIYGVSPKDWLTERRMGYAWRLLAVQKRRPSDVAADLGFASHAAFTAAYRKHFGHTPTQSA